MIYGAIIGDMAGSEWEFHPCMKERPAEIISKNSFFTDDTVMTSAVADAVMHGLPFADALRKWGMTHYRFKKGGYGARFIHWLFDPDMGPYNSCGNGSGMRVSPVAWVADSLEECIDLAAKSAEISHNHPEGIKGAVATAGATYLARTGAPKAGIRAFLEVLGYDLSRSCDDIRPGYEHIETCQESIPEAMTAFLESTSYADCLELCISLGGDADTLCAIAGAVAEAFYGIPDDLIEKCRAMLPADMLAIVDEFESGSWRAKK